MSLSLLYMLTLPYCRSISYFEALALGIFGEERLSWDYLVYLLYILAFNVLSPFLIVCFD